MAKEKIWFNWHCPHCEHRNRVTFPFQFELPKFYKAEWECEHCEKKSKLEFDFRVYGDYIKEKPYKIKKPKKKRDKVEKKENGTKKDRGYTNASRR